MPDDAGRPVRACRAPATPSVDDDRGDGRDVGRRDRRRRARSRRRSVSVDAEPKPPRTPTASVVLPGRDDEQVGAERVDLVARPRPARPGPRPTVRITAAMPMRMPSMVSDERSRCERTASRPVRSVSSQFMTARPAASGDRLGSLELRRRGCARPARPRAATSCSWVISTIVRPAACSSSSRPSTSVGGRASRGCRSARRRGSGRAR